MTNYNDGKWHGWNGGECPVHQNSVIEVLHAKNGILTSRPAGITAWGIPDLVAFRVIKEHREPKEYTIDPRKNIIWYSSEDDLVHVKEV